MMTNLGQLEKLTSKYNLRLIKSDRKFYKKYCYKLAYYVYSAKYPNMDYFDKILDKRVYAFRNNMHIRREQGKINVYATNIEDLQQYINEFSEMDYVELAYFPEDVPVNVKLRKTQPEYPYEVKLRRHVNKETLQTFWQTHCDKMWINKDSKYELDLAPELKQFILWIPKVTRTKTWLSTTWRFNDEDVKNLFVFTFGEHVQQETLYKKESTDE